MNTDKDYYRILGVLDDAEDVVIKAAYRALAQRYHPDRWKGDTAEANRRMGEINEAYGVLSDAAKRAIYDAQRDKNQFRDEQPDTEDEAVSKASVINKDWEIATKYYSDLQNVENALNAISHALAFTFRLTLLESKRFDESRVVARELEEKYLSKYFGDDTDVQAFAKELILEGRQDAAKELNEALRVLGNVDSSVIEKITRDFKTARFRNEQARRAKLSDRQRADELRPKGNCPLCNAVIPVASQTCFKCNANFTHPAGWKVIPMKRA